MNEIKVSVLMPVYNTREYLEQSINSVLSQSLKEFELIIINDGSTDDSLNIIKRFAENDKRIKFFSQENKGVSFTRNVCLEYAQGEYIYYMDSDDILEGDALDTCYNKCLSQNLDFVFFDADIFHEEGCAPRPISYNRYGILNDSVFVGIDVLNDLLDKNAYNVPVWLHFINLDFIRRNNIIFVPNIIHEDQIFTTQIYIQAQRTCYIPQKLFHRRIRANSIMGKRYSMYNINSYFLVAHHLLLFAKGKDHKVQSTIDKLLTKMMNIAIYQANILGIKDRSIIFYSSIGKYQKYVSIKSYCVLLFPFFITLKSYLKKVFK